VPGRRADCETPSGGHRVFR